MREEISAHPANKDCSEQTCPGSGGLEGETQVLQNSCGKRVVDVVVAASLLLVTMPVILVLAITSAVTLRAWPFFVHERVGRYGESFHFVKLRTLPQEFAVYADKTRLGGIPIPTSMRLLRASHLDELPQLWLVLTGKMSLVGPRPEMPMLHERLSPPAALERVSVRPGITGLWQVSAHCDGLIWERVEYDRLYVRYASPLLDLWILAKTVEKIVLGRRIHLYEIPRWAVGAQRRTSGPDRVLDLTEPVTATVRSRPVRSRLAEGRLPAAVGAD